MVSLSMGRNPKKIFFLGIFLNMKGGEVPGSLISVATVFGLENPAFWPEVTFYSYMYRGGGAGGGATGLGNNPTKTIF